MKIGFLFKDNKKYINLHHINTFYCSSLLEKSKFFDSFSLGLSGKDKSLTVDYETVVKDEYNVIVINSKDSIIDHLKVSTKSMIRKIIYDETINKITNDNEIELNIESLLLKINSILDDVASKLNIKINKIDCFNIKACVDSEESLLDAIVNFSIEEKYLSASYSKALLIYLAACLKEEKKSFVIIDDFDSYIDEEEYNFLFEFMEQSEKTFCLFTNKPSSICYTLDNYGVFNIRNSDIYDFSNIKHVLKISQDDGTTKETFEEYMSSYGYLENSGFCDKALDLIKYTSPLNFGRMLINEHYSFFNESKEKGLNAVIVPYNEIEYKFLKYVDSLINNK